MDKKPQLARQSVFKRVAQGIIVGILLCFVAWLLRPGIVSGPVARSGRCAIELSRLAAALNNYHEVYGSFPPAFIADSGGKPMHSWRALILPFVDTTGVSAKYRFDEPWDGPHNRMLHAAVEPVFHCPWADEHSLPANRTDYVAVVGPATAWPGTKPIKLDDITDDKSRTILLVEIANSDIQWLEPRDLKFEDMSFGINDPDRPAIGNNHPPSDFYGVKTVVVNAIGINGTSLRLPATIAPETLKALFTIHGGETINASSLK